MNVNFLKKDKRQIPEAWETENLPLYNTSINLRYTCVNFNKDGTRIYVGGFATLSGQRGIYQYKTRKPFSISNVVYEGFLQVPSAASPANIFSINFNIDGTKVFFNAAGTLREYSCSEPWNILTSTSINSFSLTTQDSANYSMYFKPDGTKLYTLGGTNDRIYQYSLPSAWNISGISYDNISLSVSGKTTTSLSLNFKPDGSKLYVSDVDNNIYEYSTSDNYNLTSYTFTNNSVILNSYAGSNSSLVISENGKYIYNGYTNSLNRYELRSPWDITSYSKDYDYLITGATNEDVYIDQDGYNLYYLSNTYDLIYRLNLSTPYNLSSYNETKKAVSAAATGFYFNPDGIKIYTVDSSSRYIYEYTGTTAFDITSFTYLRQSNMSLTGQTTTPQCITFKPDGTKIYIGDQSYKVFQYSLSTPWDITTMTYEKSGATGYSGTIFYINFKSDGHFCFIGGYGFTNATTTSLLGKLTKLYLSTPWDISTARIIGYGNICSFRGLYINDNYKIYKITQDNIGIIKIKP